jgi:hypothetical protein
MSVELLSGGINKCRQVLGWSFMYALGLPVLCLFLHSLELDCEGLISTFGIHTHIPHMQNALNRNQGFDTASRVTLGTGRVSNPESYFLLQPLYL